MNPSHIVLLSILMSTKIIDSMYISPHIFSDSLKPSLSAEEPPLTESQPEETPFIISQSDATPVTVSQPDATPVTVSQPEETTVTVSQPEETNAFKLSDLYAKYPWIDDLVARFIEISTRVLIWILARFAFKYNVRFSDFV